MEANDYMKNHWIKNQVWTHLEWPKHQARLKQCADFLDGDFRDACDVGCACGHSTVILHKFLPISWTGIDFSLDGIAIAKNLFPQFNFMYCDKISNLKFFGLYDGVVCSEVIEHVENDKELVESLLEVTHKRLVITTPNIKINDPGHRRLYTLETLNELFRGYKYKIESLNTFFYVIIEK